MHPASYECMHKCQTLKRNGIQGNDMNFHKSWYFFPPIVLLMLINKCHCIIAFSKLWIYAQMLNIEKRSCFTTKLGAWVTLWIKRYIYFLLLLKCHIYHLQQEMPEPCTIAELCRTFCFEKWKDGKSTATEYTPLSGKYASRHHCISITVSFNIRKGLIRKNRLLLVWANA